MRATTPDDARSGPTGGRHAAAQADQADQPHQQPGRQTAPATQPLPAGSASEPPTGPATAGRTPAAKPPAGPNRRLPAVGAAVAAIVVIAVVLTRGSGDRAAPSATPVTPSTTAAAAAAAGTRYGVFGQTSKTFVTSYEKWLGADVGYVVDFSARDTWDNIANPQYLLDEWKGTPYRLVYAVPMVPTTGATMKAGANGDYDGYFTTLAQNLVNNGQDDAILRVGWEFNLQSWAWATDDPTTWKAFYRNIVTAMRSVPGQHFSFDWNVNNGSNAYDAQSYYPGDDVVDTVGVDTYDVAGGSYPYPDNCDGPCFVQHEKQAWDQQIYGGDRGLRSWSAFARKHDKPLSLPEWGLWTLPDGSGGQDDPDFIQRMYDFITDPDNHVAYAAYFEHDDAGDGGQHSLQNSFPNGAARFKKLFVPLYKKAQP